MRITVPDEIMRLTVPTCTPSRDNPLVIVSSLEVGGPDLRRLTWLGGSGCVGRMQLERSDNNPCFAAVALQPRASHTTLAPLHIPLMGVPGDFSTSMSTMSMSTLSVSTMSMFI